MDLSIPVSSAPGETRNIPAAFKAPKSNPDKIQVQDAMARTPRSWIPNCLPPVDPPVRRPLFFLEAKRPVAMTPHAPQKKWTGLALKGSSIFNIRRSLQA